MVAAARPTVSVFAHDDASKVLSSAPLPAVFTAPIRPDVVNFVHTNMAKNKRQAYAVKYEAGMDTAAESWGTGRAVSRIPRVPGGGTHRAGQAAFGNMCRGGRMFSPTKVWRKWHRKINKNQRRYAVCSALAASAVPALVMARGHRISQVPELPLVLGGGVEQIAKTKAAVECLSKFGVDEDLEKVKDSKKVRAGKGKMRNRRYVMRKGPLVVYAEKAPMEKAFRNLPGLDMVHVDRLNLLQLAPGGHVGRFVIWTQDAFEKLDSIFGTEETRSLVKKGFVLPRAPMTNADLSRLINSDEIQKIVRPAKTERKKTLRKKNPLKNLGVMIKLNPYAAAHRRAELRAAKAREEGKSKKVAAKREKSSKDAKRAFYNKMLS
uniref:Large ribosomal subunit protein uL4 C-terminal domain-containing protein n=1 Tax=Aplanochytrium stocchinoi TaxID=215587 RepID=A0A7S3PGQ6_9STRA|mmetsp:Transcript_20388/g.24697  ORF Transcript_20388/g.24697 Transcript_20388/m.24697 type:complete len:378 (-) Transcript_20388:127-1260(-)|eukprot:CAMPEP_0204829444 /NCGR_PEP_ID=MMETSP1346-20131115/7598_1 /ASSEMBLY_ACC=CAM_ASM_000771 /TAXON_ID=215587 /ORGANISM="Aplanochytrium stocchinoi, Strain GSBS06" /LENGTH=377 /DNA_ID=CAMNT_0051959229 /DNA_START=63 /DNA_END=1196 /DNA_ORIENTATION=-